MSVREKLIELQRTNCTADKCQSNCFECMADHLIANGVTVQKHGRWINERELAGGFRCEWGYDCSECGHTEVNRKPKHCPNCGAKMDGEA